MGRVIDINCGRYSLKRGTIIILIWYLIIAFVYLLAGLYKYHWEVSESPSNLTTPTILLAKYTICVIVIIIAFFGIFTQKARFLIPVLIIRGIILFEDVIDLIWFIFIKKTIVPTSLPVFYTENYLIEVVLGSLLIGVSAYCILVIYSYHNELRKTTKKMNNESLDEVGKTGLEIEFVP